MTGANARTGPVGFQHEAALAIVRADPKGTTVHERLTDLIRAVGEVVDFQGCTSVFLNSRSIDLHRRHLLDVDRVGIDHYLVSHRLFSIDYDLSLVPAYIDDYLRFDDVSWASLARPGRATTVDRWAARTRRQVRSNPWHGEFLPSARWRDMLMLTVPMDRRRWATLCLGRCAQRPFQPSEIRWLESLVPDLGRAILRATLTHHALRPDGCVSSGIGFVSGSGRWLGGDPEVSAKLASIPLLEQQRLIAGVSFESAGMDERGLWRLEVTALESPEASRKSLVVLERPRPGSREWQGHLCSAKGLTRQERRVALGAAGGAPNRDLAARIGVALKTVEIHMHRACRKLGCATKAELAALLNGTSGSTRT